MVRSTLEAKYGPAIDGSEPIHVYLVAKAFRSAGFNGIAGVTFQSMQFKWALTLCRQESISR